MKKPSCLMWVGFAALNVVLWGGGQASAQTLPVYTPPTQFLQNIELPEAPVVASEGEEVDLSTLDSTPDPLVGIEGLHPTRVPLNAISPETLKTFVSVIDTVRRQYVHDVNDEKLLENAMRGVLAKLDGHAEFLDEAALKNLQAFADGSVASVGLLVEFVPNDNHWVVMHVAKESPADKAGISAGDYLHQINEHKLSSNDTDNDINQLLSGIAGTQVDVVVSKAGRTKRTVSLQRNQVEDTRLTVQMMNGVAIIKLPVFTNQTKAELVTALSAVQEPIYAIILDVRNNPGGVLSAAIEVASLFLNEQPVVQIVSREQEVQTLSTNGDAILPTMPVMILQNRYSASAAEVLAAALKLQNRATIAGETSYGKGSVQSIIPLDDTQAIKLTTAYYQMIDGSKIDEVGITPDLVLDYQDGNWFVTVMQYMQAKKLTTGIHLSAQTK